MLIKVRDDHIQELRESIQTKEEQINDYEEYLRNKSDQLEYSLNEIVRLDKVIDDQRRALLSKEAEKITLQEKHRIEMDSKDVEIAALLEKHKAEIQSREAEIAKQREDFKKRNKKVGKTQKIIAMQNLK